MLTKSLAQLVAAVNAGDEGGGGGGGGEEAAAPELHLTSHVSSHRGLLQPTSAISPLSLPPLPAATHSMACAAICRLLSVAWLSFSSKAHLQIKRVRRQKLWRDEVRRQTQRSANSTSMSATPLVTMTSGGDKVTQS